MQEYSVSEDEDTLKWDKTNESHERKIIKKDNFKDSFKRINLSQFINGRSDAFTNFILDQEAPTSYFRRPPGRLQCGNLINIHNVWCQQIS